MVCKATSTRFDSAPAVHGVVVQWEDVWFAPRKCGFNSRRFHQVRSRCSLSVYGAARGWRDCTKQNRHQRARRPAGRHRPRTAETPVRIRPSPPSCFTAPAESGSCAPNAARAGSTPAAVTTTGRRSGSNPQRGSARGAVQACWLMRLPNALPRRSTGRMLRSERSDRGSNPREVAKYFGTRRNRNARQFPKLQAVGSSPAVPTIGV